eukprot:scaffold738_cov340-Pavlova_lutheri.AAC.28
MAIVHEPKTPECAFHSTVSTFEGCRRLIPSSNTRLDASDALGAGVEAVCDACAEQWFQGNRRKFPTRVEGNAGAPRGEREL